MYSLKDILKKLSNDHGLAEVISELAHLVEEEAKAAALLFEQSQDRACLDLSNQYLATAEGLRQAMHVSMDQANCPAA